MHRKCTIDFITSSKDLTFKTSEYARFCRNDILTNMTAMFSSGKQPEYLQMPDVAEGVIWQTARVLIIENTDNSLTQIRTALNEYGTIIMSYRVNNTIKIVFRSVESAASAYLARHRYQFGVNSQFSYPW